MQNQTLRKKLMTIFRIFVAAIVILFFALEIFTIFISNEGERPLPPMFGNFPENRAALEKVTDPGDFTFAVVGDTRSFGTFEHVIEQLRKVPLDFGVLLGDFAMQPTENDHKYFRAECLYEYALPVPFFFVAGNHDVNVQSFPIKRFEELYGPSIFSFEYKQCLFIVLRILNPPFTNEESLNFLRSFKKEDIARYRHAFAFIHIPPPITIFSKAKDYAEADELVSIFDELGIDQVFAGDFHGWAQAVRKKTTYTITGGGGAWLYSSQELPKQFHHAMVIHVASDTVQSRIIYAPRVENIDDHLENFAITMAYPWMQKNTIFLIILNLIVLVVGYIIVLKKQS
ncbi:MAG: metallophosphoesterase [Candidatus Riflebacteria bacterium]|nr:metallophosphoesterase [Candidatus Riflebacteria bacterium]